MRLTTPSGYRICVTCAGKAETSVLSPTLTNCPTCSSRSWNRRASSCAAGVGLSSCGASAFGDAMTLTLVHDIRGSFSEQSNTTSLFQPARPAPRSELAGRLGLLVAMEPAVEMTPFEHKPLRCFPHYMGLS